VKLQAIFDPILFVKFFLFANLISLTLFSFSDSQHFVFAFCYPVIK